MMRDASLERTPYGSLLDSPGFGALHDRGTTRRPTIPRQGSGRRVSSRLSVTRTVTAEGQSPLGAPWPSGVGTLSSANPAGDDHSDDDRTAERDGDFPEFGDRNRHAGGRGARIRAVVVDRDRAARDGGDPEPEELRRCKVCAAIDVVCRTSLPNELAFVGPYND